MKKMHIVSNSHLDREHRHEFQETRYMMVEMMDSLIEIMENDEKYKHFTLDGQAIVIDDYLEVRPNMRKRLEKLIKDGRIQIGPWYSLVDCYSVNPESIIRNLVIGNRVCREYAEPMPVGYSIFSFGQMAQLPQIYAGVGIHDIIFYKGASSKVLPQSEFIWQAPDGTEAFATRLGREKRWNFFFDFDIPVILGGDAKKPGWQSSFTYPVKLCHLISENEKNQYSTELDPDIRIREDKIDESIQKVMSLLDETASEHVFLGFDGTDFTSPLPQIPEIIDTVNEHMKGELELVHSTPAAYLKDVKADIDLDKLVKYEGEMRFGPVNHVHSETMGTNTDIKQAIWYAENKIIQVLEPLSSLLVAVGGKFDHDAARFLWKNLLATHAHDSVHGSGDPKIKTDNIERIKQVDCFADSLLRRTVEGICRHIRLSQNKDDISIVVFNTTQYARNEIMKLTIDLPEDERTQEYKLIDNSGNEIDFYEISKSKFNLAMIHRQNRPKSVYCDRFEVIAEIKDIPPMGYKTIKVLRQKGSTETSTNPFPIGSFPYKPIGKSGNVLDNGLLRITLNAGSIDVYDYETKTAVSGLNAFTDIGSSGDFWVHREPYKNTHISSKGASSQIELIENSSLSATYRMKIKMDIPEGLNKERTARTEKTIPTEITTDITLKKDSKLIEFKTSLYNRCNDHLFTVSFPTGINVEKADWEAPFEIRKRDVDNFTKDGLKKGPELERQALQGFIDIHDSRKGVSLFTKGIREAGTTNDNGAVINLTLFRAASNTFPIHNDLFIGFENETSQCIGHQSFEYAVLFHGIEENVLAKCRKYQTTPIAAEVGSGDSGDLPLEYSLFKLTGEYSALSAVKIAEEGNSIIVRLYNPYNESIKEKIKFSFPVASACVTDLKEENGNALETDGNMVCFDIPAYKIITLKVERK